MGKDLAGEHYEEKFEFELWKMIREHAEKNDLCYLDAAIEVMPEYGKGVRFYDDEFEEKLRQNRKQELAAQKEEGIKKGYIHTPDHRRNI
jgi:hypothetical protein